MEEIISLFGAYVDAELLAIIMLFISCILVVGLFKVIFR